MTGALVLLKFLPLGSADVTVPDVPGVEYRLTDGRPHFRVKDVVQAHYRVNDDRPHYVSEGTD